MSKPRTGLIQRRKELGLSQEAAARLIGVATSTYAGWERGLNQCLPGFRRYLAKHLEVSLAQVHEWFGGQPTAPGGLAVPSWLGHLATLEQGAGHIQTYEPLVVYGLLQTRAYAAAIENAAAGSPSPAEVDRFVQLRLARQEVLRREPEPLRLSVVFDESVLLRAFGDGEVMSEQLAHLAEAATRPNVDLRIVPLARPTSEAAFGGFLVLTSPEAVDPYMACVFDRGATHYLERAAQIDEHVQLFRHLQDVALSCDDSRDLVLTVKQERYDP